VPPNKLAVNVVVSVIQAVELLSIFPKSEGPTVTLALKSDAQPVEELVKINPTEPAVNPDTIPELIMDAIAELLLVHIPPVLGLSVVLFPTQILDCPVILMIGLTFIETGDEDSDTHPVELLVKVKLTCPAFIPVTIPPLVIVAKLLLLLVHVPPVDGVKTVVNP
jgi:hypothetical protein